MADILIIGGGVAGVTAAARLAEDASVTLLEAEPALGYHASGRSAAIFIAQYGNETIRALNHASLAEHRETDGGVLTRRGLMLVGRPQERAAFEAEAAANDMAPITVAEARAAVPILHPVTCAYAAWYDEAYDMDTHRIMESARKRARSLGVEIVTGARVTAIRRTDGHWEVETAGRSFRAATLVNAAGAWADEVAVMAGARPMDIRPFRRSMARLPAPGGADTSGWPFIDGVNESWYAKPDTGGLLVSPSEEDPVAPHDAWADDMVLAEGLARYEEMVTAPVTRVETSWAGLRSFAPDRTPVIGRAPDCPDFFWLAGQGGYGFQTAPAASRLASDLLMGRSPALPASVVGALSPERFAA
ncbi:NAD(P)/FAD-dependent oxidoreductase [Pseudooceanicola sp. 502str34]